jgi:hypothetical protein
MAEAAERRWTVEERGLASPCHPPLVTKVIRWNACFRIGQAGEQLEGSCATLG